MFDLEVNAENNKCVFMSYQQGAVQNYKMKKPIISLKM